MNTRFPFLLLLCSFACGVLYAQPFTPDSAGYVSDPKFHQLITARGYTLVGAFSTMEIDGKQQPGARVLKGENWYVMDQYAKLYPVAPMPEEKRAIEGLGEEPRPTRPLKEGVAGYELVQQNGKYGLNRGAVTILTPVFEFIRSSRFSDSLVFGCLNGSWGAYALADGHPVSGSTYNQIEEFIDGEKHPQTALKVRCDQRWGMLSATGVETVPPRYDKIDFEHRYGKALFRITLDGKIGWMDGNGAIVVQPEYTSVSSCDGCNVAIVFTGDYRDRLQGISDLHGHELIAPVFSDLRKLNGTLYATTIKTPEKWSYGLVDLSTGKQVLEPVYATMGDYSEGLISVGVVTEAGTRYGFIDTLGNLVVEPVYVKVNHFRGDVAAVTTEAGTGVINRQGKILVQPGYETLTVLYAKSTRGPQRDVPYSFVYFQDKHCGVSTFSGKTVLPPEYDYIRPAGTYFIVLKNKLYGIADAGGKLRIPHRYSRISDFTNGLFQCEDPARPGVVLTGDLYGHVQALH